MSSRKEHRGFERMILGRSYPNVHKVKKLDGPAYKAKHRRFFHDLKTDVALAILFKAPKAGISVFLHNVSDFSKS